MVLGWIVVATATAIVRQEWHLPNEQTKKSLRRLDLKVS